MKSIIATAAKVAAKSSSVPSITCIRITANSGKVKIHATNFEMEYIAYIGDIGIDDVDFIVNAQDLYRSVLSMGEITLSVGKKFLTINGNGGDIRLEMGVADDFPNGKEHLLGEFSILPEQLIEDMKNCSNYTSKDDAMGEICNIRVAPEYVAATNGHKGMMVPNKTGIDVNIPPIILPIIDGYKEYSIGDRHIAFRKDNETLIINKSIGKYPDIAKGYDGTKDYEEYFSVDRGKLLGVMEVISNINPKDNRLVKMSVKGGVLTILIDSGNMQYEKSIQCKSTIDFVVGFNLFYLKRAVIDCKEEEVLLKHCGSNLKAVTVGEDQGVIIMPLKINVG